jgi:hypothetical protein
MQFAITAIALLSALTSAAPTSKVARGSGNSFNLVFTGVGTAPEEVSALNTGKWYVATYNERAQLLSESDKADVFYKYSPEWKIGTAGDSLVITPGGTATVPSGKPVQIVNNNATAGVSVMSNASGIPTLWYEDGRFQACADATPGQGIFLSYIAPGQRRLAACAPVELVAVCSTTGEGSASVGQLGEPLAVACQ